jgi:hypothetical protein
LIERVYHRPGSLFGVANDAGPARSEAIEVAPATGWGVSGDP